MKNTNGFGCIVKLGGNRRKKYAIRITVGWDGNKQIRKYLSYHYTQEEALIALAEYHKNGINLDVGNLTLNEVFDKWLERLMKRDLSDNFIRSHNMAKNRFGTLGDKPIKDIRTIHLQQWMDDINLKPRSKVNIRGTMVQVYKYAVTNDIVVKNYAEGIEISEKAEAVGAVFTNEEIKTLWEHKDDEYVQRILILIYTGMRVNELLKMQRDHINLEENYAIGGSKTEAGKNRIIPFHDKIMEIVKEQLGDHKYVTRSSQSDSLSYNSMLRQFNMTMEKLGMKHKIHDTRKTAVSIMHSAGLPMEVIRMIVGHSGKGVTEKVYLFKEAKELVDAVNTIVI